MNSTEMDSAASAGRRLSVISALLAATCLSAGAVERANDAAGWIPAQTFIMGDRAGDGRQDEQPAHPVTLSRYWMSPRLVTAAEYCDFLNDCGWVKLDGTFIVPKEAAHSEDTSWGTLVNLPFAPIELKGDRYFPKLGSENKPMYYVTWDGAAYYCNWLSLKHGLKPCYLPKQHWAWNAFANGYHLPTEAQWECAARAGQAAPVYPWGNQASARLANYANQVGHTTDVAAYPPNG